MTTIDNESSLARVPKTIVSQKVYENGKRTEVKSFQPLHQAGVSRGRVAYQTTSFKGVPLNLFQGNSRFVGQLQQGSMSLLKSATLKVNFQITGASGSTGVLKLASDMFERIEIKAQNGAKPLTVLYSDTMLFNYNLVEGQKLKKIKQASNIGDNWAILTVPGSNNSTTVVRQLGNHTVYLPLVGSVFGLSDIFFQNSVGDLNFEFYPNPNFYEQGVGNTVLNCLGIDLITETELLTPRDEELHLQHFNKSISSHRFLEPVENHFYNVALNVNNQELKFDLDAIVGDVSHLLVFIHSAGERSIGLQNLYGLGTGTVDVQNSSGKSLFGNGVAVPYTHLNSEVFNSHIPTDFNSYRDVILVPFCSNVLAAYHGKKDGYLALRGQRHYLVINPNISGIDMSGLFDVKIYAFIHRTFAQHQGRFSTVDDHS